MMAVLLDSGFLFASLNASESEHQATIRVLENIRDTQSSRNTQGGRDIIARGELIPGQEPLLMAVEVKHRRTIARLEIQKALWQNRQIPALLFVTSGRFTAGVLQEKALPENQLRLFLKDGEALGDLIRNYDIT